MKLCLSCGSCLAGFESICDCGGVAMVDGFEAYAPELARGGGGFKESYFEELARMEPGHFWFRFRNRLIMWALSKYAPGLRSFLEVGCGTGFVLTGVSEAFPQARLCASEIFTAGLKVAAARVPAAKFVQMDARAIPFTEEFDAVGAFDVLEHIDEDDLVLAQLHGALKPRGLIILTVPQHDWLWSAADEYACHVRRYSRKLLHRKVEAAGFRILRSTSFVSTLLPVMTLSRLVQPRTVEDFDPTAEFRISPWVNATMSKTLNLEFAAITAGVNLPVGGSRLLVAQKFSVSQT